MRKFIAFASAVTALIALSATLATTASAAPLDPAATVASMLHTPASLDGSGVAVGVIDSGIAVYSDARTNPCFDDSEYAPAEQTGDTAYTNNKVVVVRGYGLGTTHQVYPGGPIVEGLTPEAMQSHGSHVAGIIGCDKGTTANTEWGTFTINGVAPKVTLGAYNVFPGPDLGGMSVSPDDESLSYAVRDAVNDGMDVINLSLGSGHTAQPMTQQALTDAYNAGVIPVVASGNEGPDKGSVGTPGNNPDVITVGSVDSGLARMASVTVSGRSFDMFVAKGVEVTENLTGTLVVVPADVHAAKHADDEDLKANKLALSFGCTPEAYQSAKGKVAIVARGVCTFVQKSRAAFRGGAAAVIIVNYDDSAVGMSGEAAKSAPAGMLSLSAGRFLVSNTGQTATLKAARLAATGTAGDMSWFSSQGPTFTGLNKPDVVAPGAGILSAATADSCEGQSPCFAVMSGTSMATPEVAGVVALVRQAHPEWTAAMVRSAVIHTADLASDRLVRAQGAGAVNATSAINARLGFDVTGVAVHDGQTATVNVINPTSETVSVSFKVVAAPMDSLNGSYTVTNQVTIPAGSTAPITVGVSGSQTADNGMLVATTSDGYSIHAVISTIK